MSIVDSAVDLYEPNYVDHKTFQCYGCDRWFYFRYSGVNDSIEYPERSFICKACAIPNSPGSEVSTSASVREARIQLEVQRLAEEKRLREKMQAEREKQELDLQEMTLRLERERMDKEMKEMFALEKEYIQKKYDLLHIQLDENVDVGSLRSRCNRGTNRIEDWITYNSAVNLSANTWNKPTGLTSQLEPITLSVQQMSTAANTVNPIPPCPAFESSLQPIASSAFTDVSIFQSGNSSKPNSQVATQLLSTSHIVTTGSCEQLIPIQFVQQSVDPNNMFVISQSIPSTDSLLLPIQSTLPTSSIGTYSHSILPQSLSHQTLQVQAAPRSRQSTSSCQLGSSHTFVSSCSPAGRIPSVWQQSSYVSITRPTLHSTTTTMTRVRDPAGEQYGYSAQPVCSQEIQRNTALVSIGRIGINTEIQKCRPIGSGELGEPAPEQSQKQKQEAIQKHPAKQEGHLSYKREQLKKQQDTPDVQTPKSSSHEGSPSSHASSFHAAALQRAEEDFSRMERDKEKLRTTNLLPVLVRPNAFGKFGIPVMIELNYVQMLLDKLISNLYRYDVNISPAASRKWQQGAFMKFAVEVLPKYRFAFDDELYRKEITLREDGRDRKLTITMMLAGVVDMNCLKSFMNNGNLSKPMAAIQCLDVVLRTAYDPRFVKFKKSIYAVPDGSEDIGSNHDLWYGLFQSVILVSKPFLDIEVFYKSFPSGDPILQIICAITRSNTPDRPEHRHEDQHDYLKGMELCYNDPDVEDNIFESNSLKYPANQQIFQQEDGSVLTIEQYFRQKGNPVRYPNLPVMHVGSRVRKKRLPMALSKAPRGQTITKKHPDSCTQIITKCSSKDIGTRKMKNINLFNQIHYIQAPTIQEFGVNVGNAFEVVDGRIIVPSDIVYRNNKRVNPFRGTWRSDNWNYIVPSTAIKNRQLRWTIPNLDSTTRQDVISDFGNTIYGMSQRQGIQLQLISVRDFYMPRDMKPCIREFGNILVELKKNQMDLVIMILLLTRKKMYIGADTSHLSPDETNIPNGVTASTECRNNKVPLGTVMDRNIRGRAIFVKVHPAKDGRVWSAKVRTRAVIFHRPVTKLAILDALDITSMA